jgi:hypothetical protein
MFIATVRNAGVDFALGQSAPDRPAAVVPVPNQCIEPTALRARLQHEKRLSAFMPLARRDPQHRSFVTTVGEQMPFSALAATTTAYALAVGLFIVPPRSASRWARSNRSQTTASRHLRNRLQTVFHFPRRNGRSLQSALVHSIQRMPLSTVRCSWFGRFLRRRSGCNRGVPHSHSASVSSWRRSACALKAT